MTKKNLALLLFSFGVLIIAIGCCIYSANFLLSTARMLQSRLLYLNTSPTLAAESEILDASNIIQKYIFEDAIKDEVSEQSHQRILSTIIPENDIYALADEFRGIQVNTKTLLSKPENYVVGDVIKYWVLNVDTNKYRSIDADLQYVTRHVYFWTESGLTVDNQDIQILCEEFENQIYETNREFFGSEWTPGVDNDERLHILYAKNLGGAAGYFSSSDTIISQVNPYSNEKEMFYLSADYLDLGEKYTLSTLAHEFQHMIHWFQDRNESSWVNEGFAELASDLNGYDPGGFDYVFTLNPDINLTFWPGNDQEDSGPHYGASYLFMSYFLHRFGESITRTLVSEPDNGMEGLANVLERHSLDSGTSLITPEKVFTDWTIANLINIDTPGGGQYSYNADQVVPLVSPNQNLECDATVNTFLVNQFGTDYYKLECDSASKIRLQVESTLPLLPVSPHSGKYYFWSNRGDESNMRLWHDFDFRVVKSPIEMTFWAWYDLEKDYDYAYITARVNDEDADILKTTTCTNEDPTGANYGCGWNGSSNGWILQSVDLSKYAGGQVRISFEYITDSAVNGDGLLIDDIVIESTGFFTGFETDEGAWQPEGFVRVSEKVPQHFSVSLVEKGRESYSVISLDDYQNGWLEVFLPAKQEDIERILVISALNRISLELSSYSIQFSPQ